MNKYVYDVISCVSAAKKVAEMFVFVKILCDNTIMWLYPQKEI
jgi:hypothetical protein